MSAISILAVLPSYNALPDFVSYSDLLNHAIAFIALSILFECAHPAIALIKRSGLLFTYALLIEAVQYFLPTRCAALSDIAADSVGIMFGIFLLHLLKKQAFCRFFH